MINNIMTRLVPADIKSRRMRRKIQKTGVLSSSKAALELFFRKWIGHSVFNTLTEHEIIGVIQQSEISGDKIRVSIEDNKNGRYSSRYVYEIESGYVLTTTGLALSDSFEIFAESACTPEYAKQAMMEMLSRELFYGQLPVKKILDNGDLSSDNIINTVAPMIPRYPTNYYHWMVETAPKVQYLRAYEEKNHIKINLLVPSSPPSYLLETLDILGWPEDRILQASEMIYKVNNLILPPYPERRKSEFKWLRKEILQNMCKKGFNQASTQTERIYISRENALTRQIINEDEVMDVLDEYGFKKYQLETRTLKQNAQLFADASIVVGPHGAGLTDILFAKDCSVVELFGSRYNQVYENMSKDLGFDYRSTHCESSSCDIYVDIDNLRNSINDVI